MEENLNNLEQNSTNLHDKADSPRAEHRTSVKKQKMGSSKNIIFPVLAGLLIIFGIIKLSKSTIFGGSETLYCSIKPEQFNNPEQVNASVKDNENLYCYNKSATEDKAKCGGLYLVSGGMIDVSKKNELCIESQAPANYSLKLKDKKIDTSSIKKL